MSQVVDHLAKRPAFATATCSTPRWSAGNVLRIDRNVQGLLDYSERDMLTGLLNRKTFDDSFYKTTTMAAAAFERFRVNTERHAFPQAGVIAVSIGFTRVRPVGNPNPAFERADKAVHWAKCHGRNQVVSHGELVKRGELSEGQRSGDIELF